MSIKESILLRRVNYKKKQEKRSVALNQAVHAIASSIKNYPIDDQLVVLKPIFVICDYILSVIKEEEKKHKEKVESLFQEIHQGDPMLEWESHREREKEVIEKIKVFNEEKDAAIASKTGENLPIEKLLKEHLDFEDEQVLKSFIKFVKKQLEVRFGESFSLLTDEHPKILQEYVDALKKDSKITLESAVKVRDHMMAKRQETIEPQKSASKPHLYDRCLLVDQLTRLIAIETLIKVAEEQIKKDSEKKYKNKR